MGRGAQERKETPFTWEGLLVHCAILAHLKSNLRHKLLFPTSDWSSETPWNEHRSQLTSVWRASFQEQNSEEVFGFTFHVSVGAFRKRKLQINEMERVKAPEDAQVSWTQQNNLYYMGFYFQFWKIDKKRKEPTHSQNTCSILFTFSCPFKREWGPDRVKIFSLECFAPLCLKLVWRRQNIVLHKQNSGSSI